MNSNIKNNWQTQEVEELYNLPFNDLLYKAHTIHRENFNPAEIQVSTLLSIKTGGCVEDCKYCPQSSHFDTGVKAEKLMDVELVMAEAKSAKDAGATRFCMGAAWRETKKRDMPKVIEMVKGVKELGLESCMTLGMLTDNQADELSDAGLDYYNHNIDTSPEYYGDIITTRTYQDRLDTLQRVRNSGMKTCTGGIVGMGENRADRASMLIVLANLPEQPESVPINMLVQVVGTPLANSSDDKVQNNIKEFDVFEFIRTIAVARIMMPESYVRLSAGRENMSDETQALCFFAGANSIFYGDKLLTTSNPHENDDKKLLDRLGMRFEQIKSDNKIHATA